MTYSFFKIYKSMKFFLFISLIFFVYGCQTTSPNSVKISDTKKINNIEYGIVKTSMPVEIKGEGNWAGAVAGAMIGGLLGTQVCDEKEVMGTKCQDIAVVFGTIGGAAAGTVIQAKLGDHNGFQYIISIDNCNESSSACVVNQDKAFVQGDKDPIPNGERVVIIYGKDVRIMPYKE